MRSWIEILFDNLSYSQMYINFPKFHKTVKPVIKKALKCMPSKDNQEEIQEWVSTELYGVFLKPLFEEEALFLRSLEDILNRCVRSENLSDSQKKIFSTA